MELLRRIHKHRRGPFSNYLDEAVYGANDGIITTFAVVSGATGATLGTEVIVILGVANLVADGFSMGASNFLSIRTEGDVRKVQGLRVRAEDRTPEALRRSFVTFSAFVIAGLIPILPFLNGAVEGREFLVSAVGAGFAFFFIGGIRTIVTKRGFLRSGIEMLLVGGIAASLAYGVGYVIHGIVM